MPGGGHFFAFVGVRAFGGINGIGMRIEFTEGMDHLHFADMRQAEDDQFPVFDLAFYIFVDDALDMDLSVDSFEAGIQLIGVGEGDLKFNEIFFLVFLAIEPGFEAGIDLLQQEVLPAFIAGEVEEE